MEPAAGRDLRGRRRAFSRGGVDFGGGAWIFDGIPPLLPSSDISRMTETAAEPLHRGATSTRPFTVRRGDLVTYGDGSGDGFIHRVVAAPGDVVEMRGKTLWLNGRPVAEPYVRHTGPASVPPDSQMEWQREHLVRPPAAGYTPSRDDWGPLRVPAGQYLLLADNRDESLDGRWRGFVPREAITARVVWIYFSYGPEGVRWERIGASVR